MTSCRQALPGLPASQPTNSDADVIKVRTVQSPDADPDELCVAEQLVKQSFGTGFRDESYRQTMHWRPCDE